MEKSVEPDYNKIYSDILTKKYPEKRELCSHILAKKNLSVLDVIKINNLIFNKKDNDSNTINQRLRSYDKSVILTILEYQKIHRLNNAQLARHFKMSRNTIAKWKKQILV